MVQFFLGILVTIAGFYFEITTTEWVFQTLVIGLVMSVEGLNTAIENGRFYTSYHQRIGFIKDIAAGAVFLRQLHNYWFNHLCAKNFLGIINFKWQEQKNSC
jgi:diacylglycerol kinase (ATP)